MKKKFQTPEEPDPRSTAATEKSFPVAIGQIAKILRTELKLKDRAMKVLTETPGSFKGSITGIARLLRTQIKTAPSRKKRSWKSLGPNQSKIKEH